MLCLRIDGTLEEICVTEISKISSDEVGTYLLLEDGRKISVDETEKNLKKVIQAELIKFNAISAGPLIRLHLYYSNTKSGYYPICIPVSAIKCVARSFYSYNMNVSGELAKHLPKDAYEKNTKRHQPALISFNYPIQDSRGEMVEHITVYESAEYVMSFIKTIN